MLQPCYFLVLALLVGLEPGIAYSKGYAIAGLLLFYPVVLVIAPIRAMSKELLACAVFGLFLAVLLYGFSSELHHPMMRYSLLSDADEGVDRIGSIKTKIREGEKSTMVSQGDSVFSPRIGILLGKRVSWNGNQDSPIWRVDPGFKRWIFGVRIVCEFFAFFVVHVTLFLIPVLVYAHEKECPQGASASVNLSRSGYMLLLFLIGLIPVWFGA